jgi:hypothetical protein
LRSFHAIFSRSSYRDKQGYLNREDSQIGAVDFAARRRASRTAVLIHLQHTKRWRHMKQLSLARMGALALAISAMSGAYAADTKSVAVTAIVEHPALDAVRDGVRTP